ncbi:MAG: C-terminal processing peptidase-3 [Planctomycetaceae bacterium]|nr:C-terminal processing peptidase-3 [Planctomycetaceae bacterium]
MLRARFILAILAVSVCLGWTTSHARAASQEEELYESMRLLIDSFDQIDRFYVKDVSKRELVEAALHGMLSRLDPYSNYISPDDLSRFNSQVEQEFGGIGIQVGLDPQNRLLVQTPFPGSPAYKAGIRAGDLIVKIEGESTNGYDLNMAVKRLKGKAGAAVKLGILHVGGNAIEELTVMREMIHVTSILGDRYKPDGTWEYMLNPERKIGYIRVSSFGKDTVKELKEALTSLKAAGMKALILDLRFNPGGLLSAATEVSDLFVEEGKIVSTKGRNTEEREWKAQKADTFSGFPMVCLVNGHSASASEIVSACLQDNKRAIIVGDRTFGKGSVQNVIEMEQGKSALKLTTASYHRPNGKNIHRFPGAKDTDEWGVMPDEGYRIVLPFEEIKKYDDYRHARDVLSDKGPPESDFVDRQLQKGLEYIDAQLSGKGEEKAPEQKPEEKKAEEKKAEEKKAAQIQPSSRKDGFVLLFEYEFILKSLRMLNSRSA